jgi:prevent-host-death family protein
MREIGVRELKANLSSVLHEVDEGKQVKVTIHGRHIADIVPAGSRPSDQRWRELIGSGKITPATGPRRRRAVRPLKAGRSASAIVLAEREEER